MERHGRERMHGANTGTMTFAFSPPCCCVSCAEALFQLFDRGDCCGVTVDCPEGETCFFWNQIVACTPIFGVPAPGAWSTPNGQTLLGPLSDPPGPVACLIINDDGDIEVVTAGYVHMLPNSGSVTATINGNAAYGWYHYDAGDILITTYNNPCTGCNPPDAPIECTIAENDVVPPL